MSSPRDAAENIVDVMTLAHYSRELRIKIITEFLFERDAEVIQSARAEMREAAAAISEAQMAGCDKNNYSCHKIDAQAIRALPLEKPPGGSSAGQSEPPLPSPHE